MGNLSFEITGNNSEFIKKTEEIRAAIQTTAIEVEKQREIVYQSINNAFIGAVM